MLLLSQILTIENSDFFNARETVPAVEDQNSKSSQAAYAARLGLESAVSQWRPVCGGPDWNHHRDTGHGGDRDSGVLGQFEPSYEAAKQTDNFILYKVAEQKDAVTAEQKGEVFGGKFPLSSKKIELWGGREVCWLQALQGGRAEDRWECCGLASFQGPGVWLGSSFWRADRKGFDITLVFMN